MYASGTAVGAWRIKTLEAKDVALAIGRRRDLMIGFMIMRMVRITSGGQISVPAEVRHRWNTSRVRLDDQGDRLVVEPAPEDPVRALRGAFADEGSPSSQELRARARKDERGAEDRRERGHRT